MIKLPDPNEEMPDLDAMNAHIQKVTDVFNHTPNPEIGGFTPDMLFRLKDGEWNSPECPLKLNTGLSLQELSPATHFMGLRQFLLYVMQEGGLKATATGNLSRKDVAVLVDFFWSETQKKRFFSISKVMNEYDVFPIWHGRPQLEIAGLLRKHKGRFVVPKKKQALLKDSSAGELAAHLFKVYFIQFNQGFLRNDDDNTRSMQQEADFVLFTLGQQAKSWMLFKGSAERLLHPQVFAWFDSIIIENRYKNVDTVFRDYILEPFSKWGLIEFREKKVGHFKEWDEIRVTPFYEKWISFEPL